jgi:tetratricopeptide (TPR) repeat protein
LPEAEKKRFEIEFIEKRRKVEKEIEQILVSLRSGAIMIRQNPKMLAGKAETFAQKLLQAESDCTAIGSGTPLTVVMILITTIIPMFDAAFQKSSTNSVLRADYPYNEPIQVKKMPFPYSANINFNGVRYDNYQVPEDLTDRQIQTLGEDTRERSARSLYQQAWNLIKEKKYNDAEKKLRYALRFDENDIDILNGLGEVLFEKGKYKQSLEFLQPSLSIKQDNLQAKVSTSRNYLKQGKEDQAIELLEEIVKKNPKVFDVNFYLGQAYKEQNRFNFAITCFGEVVNINPGSADATFELGYFYYKNGDKESAQIFYNSLIYLDFNKAEQLRKIAGLTYKEPPPKEVRIESGLGSGN